MLMCVEFAFNLASAQNALSRGQPRDLLQPLAWLLSFAICTLPLAFLRARYGWWLEPSPPAARQSEGEGNQFTMRGLLAATAAAAVYLAGLRWLHPDGGPRDWPLHLARFAAMGALMSLPGLLVLIVCLLCLLPGRGGVWRWLLGIAGFGSTAIAAAAVAWFGSPGEIGELAFVLVGLFMSAAAARSWLVSAATGWRDNLRALRRRPKQRPLRQALHVLGALRPLCRCNCCCSSVWPRWRRVGCEHGAIRR